MVVTTVVRRGYKPTNIASGPHIVTNLALAQLFRCALSQVRRDGMLRQEQARGAQHMRECLQNSASNVLPNVGIRYLRPKPPGYGMRKP